MKKGIRVILVCMAVVFMTSISVCGASDIVVEEIENEPEKYIEEEMTDEVVSTAGNPYPQTYSDKYGYHPGNCTYQVWEEAYSRMGVRLPAWGNAGGWCNRATNAGYRVIYYTEGAVPPSNCIIEWSGHVGWVISADSVGVNIREGNIFLNGSYQAVHEQWWSWRTLKQYRGNPIGFICIENNTDISLNYFDLGTSYIDDENAIICGRINNPSSALVTRIGAYIWDDSGKLVVDYGEDCNRSNNKINQAMDSIMEAKVALLSGRKYTFQLWAEANGKRFYSDKAQFTTSDSTPPVISGVHISNITSDGYTVTCTVTDNAKVNRVQFPTWTVYNGQDDLFSDWSTNVRYTGTRNGNMWSYRVNRLDHNNEFGTYQTHIHAYDEAGNFVFNSVDEVVLKENLKNGWFQESGNTYYYQNNVRLTGFQKINGQIYYFKTEGNSTEKGKMLKGWQKIYKRYYYFQGNGSMISGGWRTIGKKSYYFNSSSRLPGKNNQYGSVKTGLKKIGKYYYYFNPKGGKGSNGQLLTGYQKFSQGKRYFKTNGKIGVKGRMLVGKQKIKGINHYFKTSGTNIGIMVY